MESWIFLSYELSKELSNYGGSDGIEISWIKRIDKGDTSNNSLLNLASHTGTHIDYPYHFIKDGRNGSNYDAKDFVFDKVFTVDISEKITKDLLIYPHHFNLEINHEISFLIIKTGFCIKRSNEEYWKYNWGFAPETASYLKTIFPNLKAVGFDLISLTSYQNREIGRVAHRSFLGENNLLIVEDMDLSKIKSSSNIELLIISPLRFKEADGSPVTIIAKINSY